MTDFLGRTKQLFTPIDAWGEFRRGARPAAVTFILYDAEGHWRVPFVAHLPGPVPAFAHDERELEGVLEIPLDRLLDDSAWLTSGEPWRFRYLAHEESVVWGLTERIVAGLAPKLREALASPSSG